jgi:hypothetical protein
MHQKLLNSQFLDFKHILESHFLYLLEFITISLYCCYSFKFNNVLSFIILNTSNNQQSVVLRTNYNILCFVIDISEPQLLPTIWERSNNGLKAKNVSIFVFHTSINSILYMLL